MKKSLLLFFALGVIIFAQKTDSTLYKWNPFLVVGANISQIAFDNWVKGGENAITWTFTTTFQLDYLTTDWKFRNQFKFAYGRSKQGTNIYKTNENEIYLESVLSHNVGWEVDPYLSNTFRTQVAKGYDYSVSPVKEIANLFDPGYITQGIGFTCDKSGNIRTRLGVAFQEVITSLYTQYTDDPTTTEVETFKFETGFESITDAKIGLAENVEWQGKLRLFSRFESLDVWDVRWDNIILARVNSWLNVNFAYILVYEKAQSVKTQAKEALQIGIVFRIL